MRRPHGHGVQIILASLFLLLPVFGAPVRTSRIKKVGKAPNFIALSPDGYIVYATSYGTDELLKISLSQNAVTQSIVVGSSPLGLAIADQGKTALVACKDSGTVSFVDLEAFRVIGDVKVTGQPNSIALAPRGYRAFVSTYGRTREGFIHIIDIRERSLIGSIKVGASPFAVTVSPITEMVYVVMGGSNEVWVIDPDRQQILSKIPVGEVPDGIAITPDGKRVFVANSKSGDLSVIDTQVNKVLITIPIGKAPFGVAVSNDGKRVFVANYESRNVAVLPADLSNLNPETFEVDRGPTDIKVAPNNRTIYVVNELSNSIVIADLD
jgi:YVTN family beta-propeller protein